MPIQILLSPRASRSTVLGAHEDAIKIALTAPPVEGRANKALIEFLAKALKISKSKIKITQGLTSRRKTIAIEEMSDEEARERLLCTE